MLAYIGKVIGWWGMALVKFLFTPFLMMLNLGEEHWSYVEIIVVVSTGAALWSFLIFHFGDVAFHWLSRHFIKKKKIFTRRNRWFIRVKQRWGLRGLLLICGLISVPVAAFLCSRFYRHNNTALPKLILAFAAWTVCLTSLAYIMRATGLVQ